MVLLSVEGLVEVLHQKPVDADDLVRRIRLQGWCVPEARQLAGKALAAGALVQESLDDGEPPSRRTRAFAAMFAASVSEAVAMECEVRRPNVRRWHDARRAAVLRAHPEVARLYAPTCATHCACFCLAILHGYVALKCCNGGFLRCVGLAATVGAQCAFGAQALNHELCHARGSFPGRAACAMLASSVTTFPWFSYYFAGGHARHHAQVGSPRDADGDALFWMWEALPPKFVEKVGSSALAAALWASLCALLLPVAYAYSLLRCLYTDPPSNIAETAYWAADSLATLVVLTVLHYSSGNVTMGLLYLALSAAFSVGFAVHPLIAFWLFQHACVDTDSQRSMGIRPPTSEAAKILLPKSLEGLQPTISYYGSELWQWLTFQELRHLEHHDFPRVPWTRLPQLQRIAPEFYGSRNTYHVASIGELLEDWLGAGETKRFDFACRAELVQRSLKTAREELPKENLDLRWRDYSKRLD